MEMRLLGPYYVTLLVKPPKMTSLKVLFSELSFPSTKTNNCYMHIDIEVTRLAIVCPCLFNIREV